MERTNSIKSETSSKAKSEPSFAIPYGRVVLTDVTDHLGMRTTQLSALLLMMMGESAADFGRLGERDQHHLFWLALQLADEIHATVPFAVNMSKGGAA